MNRRNLLVSALALIAVIGVSYSYADNYVFRSAPAPYADPVPNVLPVEPGVDRPMYNILPVEPIMDPIPGVEPKGPISDQPTRSILPVEPIMDPIPGVEPKGPISDQPLRNILPVEPGVDPFRSTMPYANDGENSNRRLIGGSDDNTSEVDPSVYPMPVGGPMPNLPREVSRRVRNVLPKEYGSDEPGGGMFASQPVISNPIPVEPGIDPRRMPMGYFFDGENGNRRLIGGSDDNTSEVDPSVYPMPVGGPMPNLPREVSRRPRNVLPMEFGKMLPSNPRGNYPASPGITEPGDMPRSRGPVPVEPIIRDLPGRNTPRPVEPIIKERPGRSGPRSVDPAPKRQPVGPSPVPSYGKSGVVDQPNYGNVIPIRLPNPLVTQTAQVRFQPAQLSGSQIQLSVYDVTGKVVVNSTLAARRDGVYRVDLGRLSNGTYLLRLSAPGVDATQKLVVQR